MTVQAHTIGSRIQKATPERAEPTARAGRRPSLWFLISVVAPTLLAIVYFGALAADRYESEAYFVVRDRKAVSLNALAGIAQAASVGHVSEDSILVRDYMTSRDAVRDIADETRLREVLGLPLLDVAWRFPAPFAGSTLEQLHWHLQRLISVRIDTSTGISTLKVQAFRGKDAERIAGALLKHAERLINRLHARSQRDALAAARLDVETSKEAALNAHQTLNDFRVRHSVVDPARIFEIVRETLLELSKESAFAAAQLGDIASASPGTSQVATLKARIAALDAQALAERTRLNAEHGSLIAEYERLVLEREFAESSYASAIAAMHAAQMDAQRQRLFLEVIGGPSAPDRHAYPHRLWGIAIAGLAGLCVFMIGALLAKNLRLHSGK